MISGQIPSFWKWIKREINWYNPKFHVDNGEIYIKLIVNSD